MLTIIPSNQVLQGGSGAPGELRKGAETQVWLATSEDEAATVNGKYFNYKREQKPVPATLDDKVQAAFLTACEELSGVKMPE